MKVGAPETFGWVRAPEHDVGPLEAWELPNEGPARGGGWITGEIRVAPLGLSFCVVEDHRGTWIKPMMKKANSQ